MTGLLVAWLFVRWLVGVSVRCRVQAYVRTSVFDCSMNSTPSLVHPTSVGIASAVPFSSQTTGDPWRACTQIFHVCAHVYLQQYDRSLDGFASIRTQREQTRVPGGCRAVRLRECESARVRVHWLKCDRPANLVHVRFGCRDVDSCHTHRFPSCDDDGGEGDRGGGGGGKEDGSALTNGMDV